MPSNITNMTIPDTNPAIVKDMGVGGKLVDARLIHTNGVLTKTTVPIFRRLSDIADRKCECSLT